VRPSRREKGRAKRLDAFPAPSVGSAPARGCPIPDQADSASDFERLERSVATLLEKHRRLVDENAALRREIEDREHRVRRLDEQVLELNQRRSDVTKRIDDLIAQLDHLEAQLGASGD